MDAIRHTEGHRPLAKKCLGHAMDHTDRPIYTYSGALMDVLFQLDETNFAAPFELQDCPSRALP